MTQYIEAIETALAAFLDWFAIKRPTLYLAFVAFVGVFAIWFTKSVLPDYPEAWWVPIIVGVVFPGMVKARTSARVAKKNGDQANDQPSP